MLRQRQPRQEDGSHLEFIRGLPCCVCGDNTCTEAAHLRRADPRVGKPYTGKAEKPDDCWTLPLCGRDHRTQHEVGENHFWKQVGIDPSLICLALYRVSGDQQIGEEIVLMAAEHGT